MTTLPPTDARTRSFLKASIAAILCTTNIWLTSPTQAETASQQPPSADIRPLMTEVLGKISHPLKDKGFTHVESIFDLEEHFADEMSQAPKTTKPVYQAAIQVCEALTEAIRERAIAKGDLRAAKAFHSSSDLGVTHNSSDIRRERMAQKQAEKEAKKNDAYFTAAEESRWTTRATQLRASIEGLYERERGIERESNAAETAESQKRAVSLYPQLTVADSPLNQEFLRRHNSLKASNDPMLQNPDWPELVAKQSSDAISAPAQAPTPADKKDDVSQPAQNAPIAASLAEKLAKTKWSIELGEKTDSFVLNPDMTVKSGWRKELGWWKVRDDSSIEAQVTNKNFTRVLTFNKALTEATDQLQRAYHRLDTPAAP